MADPHRAQQLEHVLLLEYVTNHPVVLVEAEAAIILGDDAGRVLPAVLQR